jgi:mannose-6-phosphate isomerase
LHWFHPQPGDCVFVPAGTVHALGAGLLVAEIQQSSDTTFRLFDWNRVDANGNPRPLHVAQALDVTDYGSGPVSPRRLDSSDRGPQTLVSCDKFKLSAVRGDEMTVGGDGTCHLVTVPHGEATVEPDAGEPMRLRRGETVLLPAALGPTRLGASEDGVLLEIRLP